MDSDPAMCPCCRRPLPSDVSAYWDKDACMFTCARGTVRFTRRVALFFDVLWTRRRRGPIYSMREIADAAYSGSYNGGPDYAENGASVALVCIRKLVEPLGWTVTRNVGRPKPGLHLIEIDHQRSNLAAKLLPHSDIKSDLSR